MKVVCIGFSKTGTTSMEKALEILGLKVCKGHYRNNYSNYLMGLFVNGDHQRILRLMDGFDAFADAPWGGSTLYRRIEARYPDAKFILTTRPTDAWLRSLKNMFLDTDPNIETTFDSFYTAGAYGFCEFVRETFGIDGLVDADARLRDVYEKFNAEALAHFEGRDNFLHVALEHASWPALCAFLDKPIPDQAFPRMNTRPDPGKQHALKLSLTEAYLRLIECLAANDRESAAILFPVLLEHDAAHFSELLRAGLDQDLKRRHGA